MKTAIWSLLGVGVTGSRRSRCTCAIKASGWSITARDLAVLTSLAVALLLPAQALAGTGAEPDDVFKGWFLESDNTGKPGMPMESEFMVTMVDNNNNFMGKLLLGPSDSYSVTGMFEEVRQAQGHFEFVPFRFKATAKGKDRQLNVFGNVVLGKSEIVKPPQGLAQIQPARPTKGGVYITADFTVTMSDGTKMGGGRAALVLVSKSPPEVFVGGNWTGYSNSDITGELDQFNLIIDQVELEGRTVVNGTETVDIDDNVFVGTIFGEDVIYLSANETLLSTVVGRVEVGTQGEQLSGTYLRKFGPELVDLGTFTVVRE